MQAKQKAEIKRLREAIESVISTQKKYHGNATELHLAMSDIVIDIEKALKGEE